jgi:hypothetical protein
MGMGEFYSDGGVMGVGGDGVGVGWLGEFNKTSRRSEKIMKYTIETIYSLLT